VTRTRMMMDIVVTVASLVKQAVLLVLVGTFACSLRFVNNLDCPESPNN
jgi:hypothetical protein